MPDDAPDDARVARAHEMIGALRRAQDRLAALVTSLGPDDLTRPSYADEWTIADVLSHLGSGAEIFGASLEAGLAGRDAPGMDTFPAVWERWNAKTPARRAADAVSTNETFVARLEGLSDADLAGIDLDLFGMEVDAPTLARMRLSEHAVHTWDIAVSLDPAARIDPEPVALLMHTLPQLVGYLARPAGRSHRIHVRTTAPSTEYALVVDVAAGTVELAPWAGQETDASLDLPAEAFLRLVYGRAGDGRPDADLDELRPIFPGF